jgi:archaeosortase A (PGF-CTERM-specific)
MPGPIEWSLSVHEALAEPLAWVVVATFLAGVVADLRSRSLARRVTVGAWALFAVFWLVQAPHFAFDQKSAIEGVGSAIAVPVSVYVGYLLFRGRDSLLVLSRAVAVMGLIYLPFASVPILRRTAVELVAAQVYGTIVWLGYDPAFTVGPNGYLSALEFTDAEGHTYVTHIVLQCTGIGSMSIFAGLIASLDAPVARKLRALVPAIGIIYVLNVVRNVFIAVAFGRQWFQVLVDPVMAVTGYSDPGLVSFFIADRVLSQSSSVVALVGITWLVVRTVPELLSLLEEALFLLTNTEYDLHDAFAVDARR